MYLYVISPPITVSMTLPYLERDLREMMITDNAEDSLHLLEQTIEK